MAHIDMGAAEVAGVAEVIEVAEAPIMEDTSTMTAWIGRPWHT